MTRLVRNCTVFLFSLFLVHCAGPSGHRIGGQFIVDPNHQQQSRNFLGNPFVPQFTVAATGSNPQQMVMPTDTVEYSAPNWIDLCKSYVGADTDRDGLSDDCETLLRNTGSIQYGALDPYVYNGVLVGARYFDKGNTKLQLTDKEAEEWKKESKLIGVNGFGAISKESKNVIRKFSALKKRSEPDIYAFKDLFYNYSDEEVRVDQRFVSYIRSPDMFQNAGDDQYIGLARGDGSEAVPFSPSTPGDSVYYLTALAEDTDSILPSTTLMETIEFHVALPRNVDEMQVTIGTLSIDHENEIIGSRSGMYYVMNDGESILLRNDLLNQGGRQYPSSRYGAIHRSVDSCDTAHIVIVYFADGTAGARRTQLFAENIFYRLNENDSWKNFTQGMLSIQPQGGAGCNQKFTVNDPGHKKMFFRTTNAIASRVHGSVDFNTSLNPGYSNPAYIVSNRANDSGSIGNILRTGSSQIPSMDEARLSEFEKSFSQIDPAALSEEDRKLFEDVSQKIADREASLDPINQKISGLDQSIQGLDASSADFATKKADLLKEIADLKASSNLSPQQKMTLENLEAKLNAMEPTAPATPDTQIQLVPNGAISLSLKQMKDLAGLGFTFEEGTKFYNPFNELDPNVIKKTTPEELDNILEQAGKKLDSGTMTAEEKQKLANVLNSLKGQSGVDVSKVDEFLKKYAADLSAPLGDQNIVQLDPAGTISLPLDQMKKLSGLGFTFMEGTNSYNPFNELDPNVIKKTTPEELDNILEQAGKKLESGTMTPEEKQKLVDFLAAIKDQPGVDSSKIDDFMKDHAQELFNWTPEQLDLLRALDANKNLSPGFGSNIDTWSKGFPNAEASDAAKKSVADKAMAKLTYPGLLLNLSPEEKDLAMKERISIANDLKKQGFLNEQQFGDLLYKIFKLNNPKLDLSLLGKVTILPDGRLLLESAKILFDSGTSKLQSSGEQALRTVADYATNYKAALGKDVRMNITAYTDADGTEDKNLSLSVCRAESVKDFLLAKTESVNCTYSAGKSKTKKNQFVEPLEQTMAIPESNIIIEGKGEADPIADNKTAKGKALNRRVKIILSTQ